jgi:nitrite reductase (NADH) small subunit/3-phenylpropionate/trans-cinnamate dioxygenase ferredoxin subunit
MTKLVTVANLSDLAPGSCLSVEADGFGVALYNVNGTIYALDNTCPHAGGPLGEGVLNGEVVECPWHGWRFNVRTGERPENPVFKVACYRVELEGNQIRVLIPPTSEELSA